MATDYFKTLSRVESTRQKLDRRRKRRAPPAAKVRAKPSVTRAPPLAQLAKKRRKKLT